MLFFDELLRLVKEAQSQSAYGGLEGFEGRRELDRRFLKRDFSDASKLDQQLKSSAQRGEQVKTGRTRLDGRVWDRR